MDAAGDLSGAVSVFIYALLTKRAFQWQLETEFADLHWAYEQPNINCTRLAALHAIELQQEPEATDRNRCAPLCMPQGR